MIVPLIATMCLLVCAVQALRDDGPTPDLPEFTDLTEETSP